MDATYFTYKNPPESITPTRENQLTIFWRVTENLNIRQAPVREELRKSKRLYQRIKN